MRRQLDARQRAFCLFRDDPTYLTTRGGFATDPYDAIDTLHQVRKRRAIIGNVHGTPYLFRDLASRSCRRLRSPRSPGEGTARLVDDAVHHRGRDACRPIINDYGGIARPIEVYPLHNYGTLISVPRRGRRNRVRFRSGVRDWRPLVKWLRNGSNPALPAHHHHPVSDRTHSQGVDGLIVRLPPVPNHSTTTARVPCETHALGWTCDDGSIRAEEKGTKVLRSRHAGRHGLQE